MGHLLRQVRHLLPGGAVDRQPGDGAVPALQVGIQLLQAVEPPALEGVVLDVAAAVLGDAVFFRMAGPGRKRDETPVPGKGLVDLGEVRVIEAGPDDGRLQVVVAQDLWHAAEVVATVRK